MNTKTGGLSHVVSSAYACGNNCAVSCVVRQWHPVRAVASSSLARDRLAEPSTVPGPVQAGKEEGETTDTQAQGGCAPAAKSGLRAQLPPGPDGWQGHDGHVAVSGTAGFGESHSPSGGRRAGSTGGCAVLRSLVA